MKQLTHAERAGRIENHGDNHERGEADDCDRDTRRQPTAIAIATTVIVIPAADEENFV